MEDQMVLKRLTLMLQEQNAEVRARREAEYLYTAASVGAFGAVAWGVAAVGSIKDAHKISWIAHPSLYGALMCLLIAWVVISKINYEHRNYLVLRKQQIQLYRSYASATELPPEHIPPGLREYT